MELVIISAGLFILIIVVTAFSTIKRPLKNQLNRNPASAPLIIAHRGASGYCPENTMASCKKAVELGADYIEIDVQLSRDGYLVVIHDPTLERTTNGKGYVRDYNFAELQQLDAGSWFHPDFKKERIPSLEELFDKVLPHTGLLIELKSPSLYPGIEKKLAETIVKRNLHNGENPSIMVQSFDTASVKKFHSFLPSIPAGVLIKHNPAGISERKLKALSTFAQFVNPKQTMMNERLKERIHLNGMKAFTWTVNNEKQIQKFKKMNLDGIATDFPDYLKKTHRLGSLKCRN
ncbi:glycerophosphodiester phosphodiesterase family protein [Bacillus sp. CECT 9360]|uniref:glycerophosphodiester phosphodiesterase n=1 Tax=Bacillus sp. CECT 9360 TaxID=2845821 RepID=UPI001E40A65A|nr:glycerophosphodiester phosphodiesterase family protein [Bacillus sp. CECT 9360]CAH0345820.1 Glycerophosphodiester phosphodiesterase [Bacillus sp. CECT 9360]